MERHFNRGKNQNPAFRSRPNFSHQNKPQGEIRTFIADDGSGTKKPTGHQNQGGRIASPPEKFGRSVVRTGSFSPHNKKPSGTFNASAPRKKMRGGRIAHREKPRGAFNQARDAKVMEESRKPAKVIPPPLGDSIRVIPLGGVEEIGRNMTVIEYKNDIIVIDAGLQFSEDDTPGIDYILPNTKYLR